MISPEGQPISYNKRLAPLGGDVQIRDSFSFSWGTYQVSANAAHAHDLIPVPTLTARLQWPEGDTVLAPRVDIRMVSTEEADADTSTPPTETYLNHIVQLHPGGVGIGLYYNRAISAIDAENLSLIEGGLVGNPLVNHIVNEAADLTQIGIEAWHHIRDDQEVRFILKIVGAMALLYSGASAAFTAVSKDPIFAEVAFALETATIAQGSIALAKYFNRAPQRREDHSYFARRIATRVGSDILSIYSPDSI